MLNFVTILRSGGDYSPTDVIALAAQVRKNLTISHEFVCYTDTPINNDLVVELELKNPWPSSWAVLEMWKHVGTTIVTGLDTIVVDNIDRLGELATTCPDDEIYLCRPRNKRMLKMGFWANGITVFNGDWSWILNNFDHREAIKKWRWEQMYMSNEIKNAKKRVHIVQDNIDGWYSYKVLLKTGKSSKKPKDATIVTFAGKPRPSTCTEKWVMDAYNTHETWNFTIPFEELHNAKYNGEEPEDQEDELDSEPEE